MHIPTLTEIQVELMQNPTPGRLADLRVLLAAKYAHATDEYEKILVLKPAVWNELRKGMKSDTAAERAWEATEDGVAERHWKFQLKKIERMMNAISTSIRVKTTEAQNLY